MSYDATFESVDVPEHVRALKPKERRDGVEFTFKKGRWGHLGEATLWNRCKSHMDVTERWYPDIWKAIREGDEGRGVRKDVAVPAGESIAEKRGGEIEAH